MSPKTSDQQARLRDDSQETIMKAAVGVFARRGFEATRMTDIAKAAGVSNGLAYHYFPSKDVLYQRIVELALDTAIQSYRMALQMPGTGLEVLTGLLKAIIPAAYQGGGEAFFLIIMQGLTLDSVPTATKQLLATRIPEHFEILLPVFERGHLDGSIKKGDARCQIGVLSAILQGLTVVSCVEPGRQGYFPDADNVINLFKAD